MLNIRKGGHKDLERFYSLFEVDFDSEELLGKMSIHKALVNGTMELLIMSDDESKLELAYALVAVKNIYGYVLLKYLGVLPWYRGKGVGIDAMRLINKRYADRQGIVAELTEFADPDPDHLKRLQRFFARFGYIEIKSDYRISGTTAHVLVKPIKGTAEITPVYHRIISDFYTRILNPLSMGRMIDIKAVKVEKTK